MMDLRLKEGIRMSIVVCWIRMDDSCSHNELEDSCRHFRKARCAMRYI